MLNSHLFFTFQFCDYMFLLSTFCYYLRLPNKLELKVPENVDWHRLKSSICSEERYYCFLSLVYYLKSQYSVIH